MSRFPSTLESTGTTPAARLGPARPAPALQDLSHLGGHGTRSSDDVMPAVSQHRVTRRGQQVVPSEIPERLVTRMGLPTVEFDDDGPAPVPDVVVAGRRARVFGGVPPTAPDHREQGVRRTIRSWASTRNTRSCNIVLAEHNFVGNVWLWIKLTQISECPTVKAAGISVPRQSPARLGNDIGIDQRWPVGSSLWNRYLDASESNQRVRYIPGVHRGKGRSRVWTKGVLGRNALSGREVTKVFSKR